MAYSIVLPEELDRELTVFANLEDRPKSYLVKEAIQNYIRELKEDMEDAEIAYQRINRPNRKFSTIDEVIERLKMRESNV